MNTINDLGFVKSEAIEAPLYFDKETKRVIIGMCGLCFSKGWHCCQSFSKEVSLLKTLTSNDSSFDVKKYFDCKNGVPYIPCGQSCRNIGKTSCNINPKNRPLDCNIFPFAIYGNFIGVDFGLCPAVSQHSLAHLHKVGKELLEHLLETYTREELAGASSEEVVGCVNLGLYF